MDKEGTIQKTTGPNGSSSTNSTDIKRVESAEETSADVVNFYNEQILSAEQQLV